MSSIAEVCMINFQTSPNQYHHWKLDINGAVATLSMDVSEDDKAYHVKAEVPGVKKEDIHVAVENNQVSITTEFKKETEEKKGETVLRSERYCGMQSRSFTLMHDVDQSKAEARYQDGILELTLPKKSNGGALKQLKVQ